MAYFIDRESGYSGPVPLSNAQQSGPLNNHRSDLGLTDTIYGPNIFRHRCCSNDSLLCDFERFRSIPSNNTLAMGFRGPINTLTVSFTGRNGQDLGQLQKYIIFSLGIRISTEFCVLRRNSNLTRFLGLRTTALWRRNTRTQAYATAVIAHTFTLCTEMATSRFWCSTVLAHCVSDGCPRSAPGPVWNLQPCIFCCILRLEGCHSIPRVLPPESRPSCPIM